MGIKWKLLTKSPKKRPSRASQTVLRFARTVTSVIESHISTWALEFLIRFIQISCYSHWFYTVHLYQVTVGDTSETTLILHWTKWTCLQSYERANSEHSDVPVGGQREKRVCWLTVGWWDGEVKKGWGLCKRLSSCCGDLTAFEKGGAHSSVIQRRAETE